MFDKFFKKLTNASAAEKTAIETPVYVHAPLDGKLIPLEQVPDAAFSQKMLGDGLAIEPVSATVLAPFDGVVAAVFPTGHAIGLRSANGLECLIHVGIDTVTLEGKGFKLLVNQDQTVRKGTPLIKLDLSVLRSSGKELVTPVVLTNSDHWEIERKCTASSVAAGTDVLFVARQKSTA